MTLQCSHNFLHTLQKIEYRVDNIRAAWCTKAPAMHRVQVRARPQGPIVGSLTLHFCQRLFPRLEPMTS
ncbi:hypothetical protein R3W88_030971 [Solanum pinnatisectum]|uniref:Uncharacterized protein n=1 Tax=Solanum pinnatisectum TaxID=50273 RepID=A0AAV9LK31_9SOLN|nr:hypothetical protein R3W88_030971 [Solanum pinnatisectum]